MMAPLRKDEGPIAGGDRALKEAHNASIVSAPAGRCKPGRHYGELPLRRDQLPELHGRGYSTCSWLTYLVLKSLDADPSALDDLVLIGEVRA